MKLTFRLISFLLALSSFSSLSGQTEYGETLKSRLYLGGTFSLQFGTITNFDVSPMIGYNINRYFSAGVGATYMFYSYRDQFQSYKSHFYGGRVFGRIVPLPQFLPGFFLHTEYETINNERYAQETPNSPYVLTRVWTPAFLAGIGFRQKAGENSYFTINLLYNISDDGTYQGTIYQNVIIPRIGFIYGFY